MSKAKVRAMQRGAKKREYEAPLQMQDIYKNHPPKISNADRPHLNFSRFGKPGQVEKIKNVIDAARNNGIGSASEISRLLNKLLIKTAVGEEWTPRLAWFAAAALRVNGKQNRASQVVKINVEGSGHGAKLSNAVNRVVKSRFDEMRADFTESKPKLGDASTDLVKLKIMLEKGLK